MQLVASLASHRQQQQPLLVIVDIHTVHAAENICFCFEKLTQASLIQTRDIAELLLLRHVWRIILRNESKS